MSKFILLDHSLTGLGGHHYSYAAQILAAAQSVGFETHLACGEAAVDLPEIPGCDHRHALFPYPSYGKWSRLYDERKQLKQLDQSTWAHRVNPVFAAREWKLHLRRSIRRRQFVDACCGLFDRFRLSADDHVFLPTTSEFDLLALSELLRDAPQHLAQAVWHVQFHLSFWDGRECDLLHEQLGRVRYLRDCFREAQKNTHRFDLRYYATTPALAEHYNQLEVVDFTSLPYPAALLDNATSQGATAAPESTHCGPIRALAGGKPRSEKGAQFLPALIANLWDDLLATGKLQLTVQTPVPCRTLLPPQARLSPFAKSAVRAAKYPLAEPEYNRMLREADIGLFLYDSDEYYARASGIMTELLALGKPVITPAGCWLSEQGSEAEESYLDEWRRNANLLKPYASHEITTRPQSIEFLESPWDGESTGLLWRCEASPQNVGPARIEVQQQGSDGCWSDAVAFVTRATPTTTAFIPIRASSQAFRLRAYPAFGLKHPVHLVLHEHRVDEETSPPCLGSHNLAAADWRETPRLLRDVVENYGSYRAAAERAAASWSVEHHPLRTLERLTGRSVSAPFQSARAA